MKSSRQQEGKTIAITRDERFLLILSKTNEIKNDLHQPVNTHAPSNEDWTKKMKFNECRSLRAFNFVAFEKE